MNLILRSKIHTTRAGFHVEPIALTELVYINERVSPSSVITLIGGGGKTSLMYLWARCLQEKGFSVVTCTTTKMSAATRPGVSVFQTADMEDARTILHKSPHAGIIITLTGGILPETGKLAGIPSDWIDQLNREFPATIFLVEGDGSAGRSLKGHLPHEPVIPGCTSLLIPVIGLDVLGKPLNADNVHRPEVLCEITGTKMGASIGTAEIFSALIHEKGYLRQVPKTATVVPLLNKVENLQLCKCGITLAQQILKQGHPQIKSVLAGSVHQHCFMRLS